MRSQLLMRNGNFDWSKSLPWNSDALVGDLSLDTLFKTMAKNDRVIFEAVEKVILGATSGDHDTVLYRQAVLRDCLSHEAVVRSLYNFATEAMDKEKKHYLGTLVRYPHWLLDDAVSQMEMFGVFLSKLRSVADNQAQHFGSEGWVAFFSRIKTELNDEYFQQMAAHLKQLRMRGPTLLSAGLDAVSKPNNYVLHRTTFTIRSLWQKIWAWFFPPKPSANSFSIHPRDEAGARALEQIRDEGIAFVTTALAQARDHIREFFSELRSELAFYLGCVNLHRALTDKGEPVCFPIPLRPEKPHLQVCGLFDVSLSLTLPGLVVGSDADAGSRSSIIITGANQGGKSTFLRALGLAQLMMHAGIFVAATSFSASISRGLFTHYKREESAAMESGKFDEELARMSEIVDRLSPASLVLFNESFAATNEREGSEVGFQIMSGLIDSGVRIVCVTHLYALARKFLEEKRTEALFLRPERLADGKRTFRLLEGEPQPSSFGGDLYNEIFSSANFVKHLPQTAKPLPVNLNS